MLTVVTPASSTDLASLDAVKAALDITDTSEDQTLPPLIARASAAISAYCNRTFALEMVEESFGTVRGGVVLGRYPVTSITSVSENGIPLGTAEYEADLRIGVIDRTLLMDPGGRFDRGRTVVRYTAGYALDDMPGDIVQALVLLVAHFRSTNGRDPLLRAEETTDIERLEYFIQTDQALPGPVRALLDPHRKPSGF